MSDEVQVRVGGQMLSSIGWWGGLTVTHQWPRGCWQADWSMALDPLERPPALVQGAPVEVLVAGAVVWAGYLSELNWSDGTFSASGAAREGEETLCLAADGTTSSTPDVVIDAAISRGALSWSRPASLSATALTTGDDTQELNYVTDLLDTWSTTVGKRWAVNSDRQVYAAADPTSPAYYVAYGAAEFGVADDALVGTLTGGWFDVNGAPHLTTVGTGRPEVAVNMANLGPIDSTTATNVLTAILAKTGARLAFTNAVTVTAEQVWSSGGASPHLSDVRAGLMFRLLGLEDPRDGSLATDVLMGESVWDVDAATVQLTPIDLAARDLSSIVADAGLELL
jgi:hypothetical protein